MNLQSASGSSGSVTTENTCQALASIGARHMLPAVDDLGQYCIFLDLDGTLVEIEDRPDDVRVDAATLEFIERLHNKVGRALAVVSGRDICVIDRLLHPLVLPVAGVHGLQRRDAAGRLHSPTIDQGAVEAIATRVEAAFVSEPGVVIERKTGAVAIHYRLRPDFERRCQAVAQKIVRDRADLNLITGKMVCEIRLHGNNKGGVISSFLEERPFKGKRPIFAGDDVTDESGFIIVNACGGISIKIGEDLTAARYRAANVVELRKWFDAMIAAPDDFAKAAGIK